MNVSQKENLLDGTISAAQHHGIDGTSRIVGLEDITSLRLPNADGFLPQSQVSEDSG